MQSDRLLVFMDRNSDLYICSIMQPSPIKLATAVQSYAWNDASDILAAITDNQLVIWYYPAACLLDKQLVDITRERKRVSFGESATIQGFSGQLVTVRQSDGVKKYTSINPYVLKLYSLVRQNKCAFVA
jgi:hypothetical protein